MPKKAVAVTAISLWCATTVVTHPDQSFVGVMVVAAEIAHRVAFRGPAYRGPAGEPM